MWSHNEFSQVYRMFTAIRALNEENFSITMEVYRKYTDQISRDFSDRELAAIPKEMYMMVFFREVGRWWPRLPKHQQEDCELQGYRQCLEHYNIGRDHIDGPPSMRKDCAGCRGGSI